MGIWSSLYYPIVTMISLMKWKITSLVQQCKCNVVIYKPYLGIIATCTMAIRPIVKTSDSLWPVLLITKALHSSTFRGLVYVECKESSCAESGASWGDTVWLILWGEPQPAVSTEKIWAVQPIWWLTCIPIWTRCNNRLRQCHVPSVLLCVFHVPSVLLWVLRCLSFCVSSILLCPSYPLRFCGGEQLVYCLFFVSECLTT